MVLDRHSLSKCQNLVCGIMQTCNTVQNADDTSPKFALTVCFNRQEPDNMLLEEESLNEEGNSEDDFVTPIKDKKQKKSPEKMTHCLAALQKINHTATAQSKQH